MNYISRFRQPIQVLKFSKQTANPTPCSPNITALSSDLRLARDAVDAAAACDALQTATTHERFRLRV